MKVIPGVIWKFDRKYYFLDNFWKSPVCGRAYVFLFFASLRDTVEETGALLTAVSKALGQLNSSLVETGSHFFEHSIYQMYAWRLSRLGDGEIVGGGQKHSRLRNGVVTRFLWVPALKKDQVVSRLVSRRSSMESDSMESLPIVFVRQSQRGWVLQPGSSRDQSLREKKHGLICQTSLAWNTNLWITE